MALIPSTFTTWEVFQILPTLLRLISTLYLTHDINCQSRAPNKEVTEPSLFIKYGLGLKTF